MDKLAVTGDSIVLQPTGFLWQAWDGKLPLRGANPITSEGKSVILEADVMQAALQGISKMYVAPPFATPGTVVSLQLVVAKPTLSLSVNVRGQAVVTAATMGTFTASVVPAVNPQGVPDPLLTKVGQWTVQTTSQSKFQSGVPTPAPAATPESDTGAGSASTNAAKQHWVGVSIEGVDGQVWANQRISVTLPNGEVAQRSLGDSGATRLDGIRFEGERECLVRAVFDPSRVPVRKAPRGFIAVQLIDEAGEPYAGREVILTLPDGAQLRRTLDELGRARFEPVPLGAKCKLDVAPARTVLEFTLFDEGDAPMASRAFKVTDSVGDKYEGVTDETGFARVENIAEGECTVTFELDGVVAATQAADESLQFGIDQPVGPQPGFGTPVEDDRLKTAHSVQLGGALFRLESAVVLPEGEAPDAGEHTSVSSISMFARALRHSEEQPDKSLFVAGHADTSGGPEFNQTLSIERAKVALAILEGDRETFALLAQERHQVADYKQILSWCSVAFPQFFACTPPKIDDNAFTGIEPLKQFQAQYNANIEALGGETVVAVDGDVGPDTWGAIFDVYQFGLCQELGEAAAQVKEIQRGLRFVDNTRKTVGFGEQQPATDVGDGERAQPNRRIELLFFEPADKPDLAQAEANPGAAEVYDRSKYRHVQIPARPGAALAHFTLTVELFRPAGLVGESRFRLHNANGSFDLSLSEAQATPSAEADYKLLQFVDVPMSSRITLEQVFNDGALKLLNAETPEAVLASQQGRPVPDTVQKREASTSFLEYDLSGVLV